MKVVRISVFLFFGGFFFRFSAPFFFRIDPFLSTSFFFVVVDRFFWKNNDRKTRVFRLVSHPRKIKNQFFFFSFLFWLSSATVFPSKKKAFFGGLFIIIFFVLIIFFSRVRWRVSLLLLLFF